MSPYIYDPDHGSSTLEEVQAGIMSFTFHPPPPMIPVTLHDTILFVSPEVAPDDEVLSDLVLNDNMFEFDHQWHKHRQYPDIKSELFELDILPDPRLYGIDVSRLRRLARSDSIACSQCGSTFEATYENYMLHIEICRIRLCSSRIC